MNIMKKIGAAGLAFVTGACMLAGCSREKHSRGPLELKKVTYVCYAGDVEEVSVYVFTPDLKLREYEIYSEMSANTIIRKANCRPKISIR